MHPSCRWLAAAEAMSSADGAPLCNKHRSKNHKTLSGPLPDESLADDASQDSASEWIVVEKAPPKANQRSHKLGPLQLPAEIDGARLHLALARWISSEGLMETDSKLHSHAGRKVVAQAFASVDRPHSLMLDMLRAAPLAAVSGRPMPPNILECQVSKMVNSDACPRPTTGPGGSAVCSVYRDLCDGRPEALGEPHVGLLMQISTTVLIMY